ncbi:MAG: L-aspartate oxidase [Candidatus Wallbacteria bacterium]|nr:L-aspartate oxidase [Candidatus Wallbacteria bacterium]
MKDLFSLKHLEQPTPSQTSETDILIIGSGIAGLMAAHTAVLMGCRVTILTKQSLLSSSSTLAQGGIACVWEEVDSLSAHFDDTMRAGYEYNNPEAVHILVEEGQQVVRELVGMGLQFDGSNKHLELGREGAHSHRRILHAGGDATGWNMVDFLLGLVRTGKVMIVENAHVYDLFIREGQCLGAMEMSPNGPVCWRSRAVILSSGGYGRIFRFTTQPETNVGEMIAISFLHGATVQDMEFVQFHPTGFVGQDGVTFLITEALRGEGAFLVNRSGERFMKNIHELAELAPRDVVARAIVDEGGAFIDARHLGHDFLEKRFPTIFSNCGKVGFDLSQKLLPVVPVAHYTIGGIRTDLNGATDLPGLYACGETAVTGCHGANRLASNSLLEGLVFGRRAGKAAAENRNLRLSETGTCPGASGVSLSGWSCDSEHLRDRMSKCVGLKRNGMELSALVNEMEDLLHEVRRSGVAFPYLQHYYQLVTSYLVARAALTREESRGVHFRTDFPTTVKKWEKRINFNIRKGIFHEEKDCRSGSGKQADL